MKERSDEPPLEVGGSQLTLASPAVPVPAIVGALISVAVLGIVTASDLTDIVPVVFAELIAVTVNSAEAPAVKPVNSYEVASDAAVLDAAELISFNT